MRRPYFGHHGIGIDGMKTRGARTVGKSWRQSSFCTSTENDHQEPKKDRNLIEILVTDLLSIKTTGKLVNKTTGRRKLGRPTCAPLT